MRHKILYLLFMFAFIACDDIIEDDISKRSIHINTPKPAFVTTNPTVTFWWDFQNDVEEYHIQIVEGRFDSVVRFLVDSFTTQNQFLYSFNPGNYEWSLRGVNSISSTAYQTRSIQVDSTNDLSKVTIILDFPNNNGIYGNTKQTFRWNDVFSADYYEFEIREAGTGNTFFADTVNTNSIVLEDTLKSGEYTWRVSAVNAESQSDYSVRNFEMDLTAPTAPTLISPPNSTTANVSSNIKLNWTSGTDKNSSHDSLYLYFSSTSSTPIVRRIDTAGFQDTSGLANGTYFWKVRSVDAVLNAGDFSPTWAFVVQ